MIPDEVIRALGDSGFLGLTIPREYGGLALSPAAYAHMFGAISSVDASIGVLIGVHCGLGSKAIVLFGSDEQKARYLPMLARGETLAAYALTEPETGSEPQHVVTRAAHETDGTWTLNGRKHWIGNAHRAGVIATFAQTTVERAGKTAQRPTAFIIRPDMPGFHVAGTVRKLGIRGSTPAELHSDDLRGPAEHVLGEVGKGFDVAVRVLNGGRLTLAGGCTAGTRGVLAGMVEFSERGVQFGEPIAGFRNTQRKPPRTARERLPAHPNPGEPRRPGGSA